MDKKLTDAAQDPRLARAMRAMLGMAQGQLTISPFIPGKIWEVDSTMSGKPNQYMVAKLSDGSWACDCPDFQKRHQDCKHIMAVKLLVEGKV